METPVSFKSDGLTLAGVLHKPDDMQDGERRPGVLVLHGFGGNKDGDTHENEARAYCDWGYVVLRFDYRGCGESEGEPRFYESPKLKIVDIQNACHARMLLLLPHRTNFGFALVSEFSSSKSEGRTSNSGVTERIHYPNIVIVCPGQIREVFAKKRN